MASTRHWRQQLLGSLQGQLQLAIYLVVFLGFNVAWTQTKYQFSSPDAWLYDINNHNGWGSHPDY